MDPAYQEQSILARASLFNDLHSDSLRLSFVMVHFTIVGDKLPHLDNNGFKHEFRKVHAEQTIEMASSTGLISRYIQGLRLSTSAPDLKVPNNLPLNPLESWQSIAELTWWNPHTLQGALHTSDYQQSAGKHMFADPKYLFLTEPLEPVATPSRSSAGISVMLFIGLTPKDDGDFRSAWDKHASFARSTCEYYQRNAVMSLPQAQIDAIFEGTQFPIPRNVSRGGTETFIFASVKEAQAFCDQHSTALAASYKAFVDEKASWCLVSDFVEQWGESDIGIKQQVIGTVLGSVLGAKSVLGF